MKKFFVLFLMGWMASAVQAQDLDKINDMMAKSQFKEARVAIDKYMSNPKNSTESDGWYYKGRIYNSLSYDKTLPETELYSLKEQAFDAFKKNQELDKKDIRLLFEGYSSYLDLYVGLYDLGARQFNAKNFEAASQSFKKALEVKDFILAKKYTYSQTKLYALDTALVLNTAVAATQAKKIEEGVAFYKKLADAGVSGKDYENVYEYLVDYYSKKGDDASLKPLLEKAKALYPKNEFWSEVEIRAVSGGSDKTALFAKYDEMLARDPNNFTLAYNYSIELYNSLYGKDAKSSPDMNITAKNKLTEVLKIAIKNEKESEATVLMANHLFNMSADFLNASNAVKGKSMDDLKKKNDLKAIANKAMDDCIMYSENAAKFFSGQPTLKTMQKANYRIVLGYLYDIYNLKNNPKKAAEYDAKLKALDKL